MAVKQLSVYIENQPGELAKIVKEISDAGINIRAMSLADTADFGVVRIISEEVDNLIKIFEEKTIVKTTDVIAVKMNDEAGALNKVLSAIDENIEYMYAFTGNVASSAYVVLRVDDTEEAEARLNRAGIDTLKEEDLTALL